jgi:hypothetical protein
MERGVRDSASGVISADAQLDVLQEELTDLKDRIESERQTLAKVSSEFQGQFSTGQNDRQASFQKLRDEIGEDLKEELDAFQEARERHTVAQEEALALLKREFGEKATGLLVEIQSERNAAEDMLAAIGQRGVATDFLGAAHEARNTKRLWQGITVVALLVLIFIGWRVFLGEGEITSWPPLAARVFLIGTVGVLSAFASAQAERYQEAERRYRQRGMEMATLGPFLATISPAEQEKLRVKLGNEFFGKDSGAGESGGKAPTSLLALVLDHRELHRTLRELLKVVGEWGPKR